MKSIFRYPGGKSKKSIIRWIFDHQPQTVHEYREPFVGGGGVFFSIPSTYVRWINDIHPGLIAVYTALRDRPLEFIKSCRNIAPIKANEPVTSAGPRGGKPLNARLKKVFDDLKFNNNCDQALRYFFINRTVHSGRVNYNIPSRVYYSNPTGWNIVKNDLLEQAAEHLQDVQITCGDYELLLTTPGEHVWLYLDPPYVVNTNLANSSRLYEHNFELDDHERLASVVKKCRHNIMLSYDNCDLIRTLYKGFNFIEKSWTYCGAAANITKATGNELLILNYEPPTLEENRNA